MDRLRNTISKVFLVLILISVPCLSQWTIGPTSTSVLTVKDSLALLTANMRFSGYGRLYFHDGSYISSADSLGTGITNGSITYAKLFQALKDSLTASASHIKITSTNPHGVNDNSITTAKIDTGAVTNVKIADDAAIAGTKISPNFGTQTLTLGGLIAYDYTATDTALARPVVSDINYIITPVANSVKAIDYHGVDLIAYSTSTATNSSTGIYPFETNAQYGGTGTIGRLVGGYFFSNNTSSGTVTDVWPIRALARNTGSGVVTNLRSVNIESGVNSGGGTVTNNIGLYIGSQTVGGSNFSIYSAGGNMYHAGKIGINTQPSYSLHVVGSATKDYTALFSDVCTDVSYSLPAMARFQAWFQPTTVSSGIDYFGQNNITYSDKTLQSACRLFGIYQNAQYGGSGTIAELVPLYAFSNNTSTGTVTQIAGVKTLLRNTSTGTVDAMNGIRIATNVNSGGGTVTTNTGIYIEDQTVGVTDYSIYSTGGNMYHAGNINAGSISVGTAPKITAIDSVKTAGGKLRWIKITMGTMPVGWIKVAPDSSSW